MGQAGAVVVVVVAWVHLLVVVVGAGVGHVVGEGFLRSHHRVLYNLCSLHCNSYLPNILHNDLTAEAAVEAQKQDQQ